MTKETNNDDENTVVAVVNNNEMDKIYVEPLSDYLSLSSHPLTLKKTVSLTRSDSNVSIASHSSQCTNTTSRSVASLTEKSDMERHETYKNRGFTYAMIAKKAIQVTMAYVAVSYIHTNQYKFYFLLHYLTRVHTLEHKLKKPN
jgi:hypothetical protein